MHLRAGVQIATASSSSCKFNVTATNLFQTVYIPDYGHDVVYPIDCSWIVTSPTGSVIEVQVQSNHEDIFHWFEV